MKSPSEIIIKAVVSIIYISALFYVIFLFLRYEHIFEDKTVTHLSNYYHSLGNFELERVFVTMHYSKLNLILWSYIPILAIGALIENNIFNGILKKHTFTNNQKYVFKTINNIQLTIWILLFFYCSKVIIFDKVDSIFIKSLGVSILSIITAMLFKLISKLIIKVVKGYVVENKKQPTLNLTRNLYIF